MSRKYAIGALAALCAVLAFDGFPARAAPAKAADASDLDSSADRPGDWMLDFKTTDQRGLASIGFVRVLRSRDAHGTVKYDAIVFSSDKRYPFGLWDTYLGKCDSHSIADIWMGDMNTDGDARGLPVAKVEYEPQAKHLPGYDTLEKVCIGEAGQTVADPVAYAHDFLKR